MEKLVKVLILLFILFLVWQIQKNNYIDNSVEMFTNLYARHHPNQIIDEDTDCYTKLYRDNGKYYLVNTKRPMVLHKNPRKFDTYKEYLQFTQHHKCPVIDITTFDSQRVQKKNQDKDDPWESYQRRCNKKVAKLEGGGKGTNNYHNNYSVEKCISDEFLAEYQEPLQGFNLH